MLDFQDAQSRVLAAFENFDCSGQGTIPCHVLVSLLRELGNPTFSDDCFSELLRNMELEADDVVNYRRFIELCWQPTLEKCFSSEVSPELALQSTIRIGLDPPQELQPACSRSCTQRASMRYTQRLQTEADAPVAGVGQDLHRYIPPEMWCITRADLDAFVAMVRDAHMQGQIPNTPDPVTGRVNPHHDNPDIGPNVHAVTQHLIVPKTRDAGGMSWALMLHPEGVNVEVFITHSWKEGVYEFHRRVVMSEPPDSARGMWICFLANPQSWGKADLASLLGNNPLADSPFAQALYHAREVLVVPNVTESIYSRLWCVAEAKMAIDHLIPVNLASDARHSGQLALRSLNSDARKRGVDTLDVVVKDIRKCQDADSARHDASLELLVGFQSVINANCSDAKDEARIREAISGDEDRIDGLIRNLSERGYYRPESASEAGSGVSTPSSNGFFGTAVRRESLFTSCILNG